MKKTQHIENFNHLFPELTSKQYSALEMFTYGSAPKQLAARMGISEDSVNQHLSATKKKLNCQSTSDLRTIFLTRIMSSIASQHIKKTDCQIK